MATQNEFSLMNHSGYAAAYHKLQELNGEYNQIELSIRDLLTSGNSEAVKALKDKKVQAVLDGDNPDEIKSEDYNESLNKAYIRKEIVRAAIEKQKQTLGQERILASREILKDVGPKYRDKVNKLAIQFIKLAELVTEERDLRRDIADNDVAFEVGSDSIRAMPLSIGDDPREFSSKFAMYVRECVEYGYLNESDIPKTFKESWRKRSGFEFKKTGLAAVLGN